MASEDIQIVKLPLEEPVRHQARRMAMILGLTLLVCGPGFAMLVYDQQAKRAALDAFWRVDGRPCAPLDPGRFRRVSQRASVTPYDGARFERHGGAMTCTHRTDEIGGVLVRYPVCKFDSPDYLGVTAGGQERFYDLTMGRAAAVGVVNGQVRCVVTPAFEM
ncbi:hypothetical protein [Caulobacter sp. 1776]|uniref:hypothetical protein n=1 Tax=Caulobacter sp. 1776 TaxID=3156420 RepID=UPI003397DDCD